MYGKVQDVGFRWATYNYAQELGLTGFVRNETDGSVLIEAEGDEEVLSQLVYWSKKGPWVSKTDRVEIADGPMVGYTIFEIKY